ncbi:hypothetical protein N7474_007867 [Penicillium riverlandense]|uniref:uncharacterized protein n=1 Tax=Penicillium riverlandense TaxID=1903569 RepID=UPI002547F337|nr:uncharacterized protein N7474_007867 [Penicillium riverlandense]KAJ5811566.1 hypothetical protein N7474_007867 [Penicillium riverlandense]
MSEPFQGRPPEEPPNYQVFETATTSIREKLLSRERRQRVQYYLFYVLFNLLTIAQVIIGAAITALGPLGDQHKLAITVLGAFNTSIAGLLALLKGRGLPQRLRRNMAELSKVLDHIEEQTVLLRYGNRKVSKDGIDASIEDVLKQYMNAKDIIERNQPDTYTDGELSKPPASDIEVEGSPSHQADNSVINGKRRGTDEEMGIGESL